MVGELTPCVFLEGIKVETSFATFFSQTNCHACDDLFSLVNNIHLFFCVHHHHHHHHLVQRPLFLV